MKKSDFLGLMMAAGSAMALAGAGVANAQEASAETKSEVANGTAMDDAAAEAPEAAMPSDEAMAEQAPAAPAPDMSGWTEEQKAAYELKKAQEMAVANAAMNAVDAVSVAPGGAVVVTFSEEAGPGKMVVVSEGAEAVDAPLLAGQLKASLALEGEQANLTVENGTTGQVAFGLGIDFDKSGEFAAMGEQSVGATSATAFNLPATIGGVELSAVTTSATGSAMAAPAPAAAAEGPTAAN